MMAASNTKDAHTARSVLAKTNQMDGRITTAFQQLKKSMVTYSHRQYTKTQS